MLVCTKETFNGRYCDAGKVMGNQLLLPCIFVRFFYAMKYKATLLNENDVNRALKRISHEIIEKNNGADNLCLIGIKRRGVPLSRVIADNIASIEGVIVPVGSLDITYYRDDLSKISEDPIIKDKDFSFEIEGKKVVLVDDVLYTGRTVRAAMDALMEYGRASSIQLAVLIDRGHRELPIRGDYVGKNIPTSQNERICVKVPEFDSCCCVELFDNC